MAKRGSPEWRERVARGAKRGIRRRKQRLLSRPRDLDRMSRDGLISPALRPLVKIAEQELGEWLEALGGVDTVPPQRRALLEDAAWLGVAVRSEMLRFLASNDPAALDRVPTLANTRRAGLQAAGLDRVREPEIDLSAYLSERASENPAQETNATSSDTQIEDADEVAGEANGG